jgi:hypothetical protein
VATPRSPIPPARASGEILKKGTADVTTLIVSVCAFKEFRDANRRTVAVSCKVFLFIRIFQKLKSTLNNDISDV